MRPIVGMIARASSTRHFISSATRRSRLVVASSSTNNYHDVHDIKRNRCTVGCCLMDDRLPTIQNVSTARLSNYTDRTDTYCRQFSSLQQKGDTDDTDESNIGENKDVDLVAEVQEANERCSGNIELKKVDGQWGVYTSRSYTEGSTVISSKAQSTSNVSCSHSIQIGWNKYTLMDLPARFLNHCCGPNIGVRGDGLNSNDSYDFVALRDIKKGEEVRFDYETTEWNVAAFEKCLCGSDECRGIIKGYRHSGDIVHDKYDNEIMAKYLWKASGRGT